MIGLTPVPASSCAAGAGLVFVAVVTAAGTAESAAALGFKVEGAGVVAAACEVVVAFAVPTAEAAVFVLEERSPLEDAWAATEAFAAVAELADASVGAATACAAATPFAVVAALA